MLETLKAPAPDKILELMGLFNADPRDDKVDLGVGVYKDAQGKTPIMRAVKAAERRLWEEQQSKSYVGLLGDPTFTEALRDLVFGDAVAEDRVAAAQTPGGTGAVRQLFEFARRASPEATVTTTSRRWVPSAQSTASWPVSATTRRTPACTACSCKNSRA